MTWRIRLAEAVWRCIEPLLPNIIRRLLSRKQQRKVFPVAVQKLGELARDLSFMLLHEAHDFSALRRAFLEGIREALGRKSGRFIRCCIFSLDSNQEALVIRNDQFSQGYSREKARELRLTLCTSAGSAYQTATTVYVKDKANDNSYTPHAPIINDYEYNSILCIPLVCRDIKYGVLNIDAFPKDAFSDWETQLLEWFTHLIVLSYALEGHTCAKTPNCDQQQELTS